VFISIFSVFLCNCWKSVFIRYSSIYCCKFCWL